MEPQIINILLVEDDEVDVMNVRRAFKKGHISNPLYVAGNGIQALEMLRGKNGQPPTFPTERRLILLDLNMPKMDGIELLVVLTTSNEDCDRVNAYELNVAGYLLKPITFATFVETMSALNKYWALCQLP
jgi:CheY-like chemotaxis protein